MEGKNESKHTPKWRWILNESSKTVRLESTESGRDTIMDFVRYGMIWAQPRFNVDGIMIKAEELGETVEGREHHSEWFKFINHPTAKLIESAPALLEENERLKKELMCPDCKGNGWQSDFTGDSSAACSTCKGSGIIPLKDFCNHLESSHRAEAARAIKLEAEVDRLTKEKSEAIEALKAFVIDIEGHPSYAAREHYKSIMDKAKDLLI